MKDGSVKRVMLLFMMVVLLLMPIMVVQASPTVQEPEIDPQTCRECHLSNVVAWDGSAHKRALTCSQCHSEGSPVFSEGTHHPMQSEDDPRCVSCHTTGYDAETNTWAADGVTCAACHSPMSPNHPDEPVPVERSAYMCGQCHTETYTEWKLSQHGQAEMVCVSCHNPHAGSLKVEETTSLCITCHDTGSENFVHSKHSSFVLTKHNQEELTCADCHLGELGHELGEGHAIRDHSFHVRLGTCSACHDQQQHMAADLPIIQPTPTPEPVLEVQDTLFMSMTPDPVSPIGFILLAILLGFGVGMVVAPFLAKLSRQISAASHQAEDE